MLMFSFFDLAILITRASITFVIMLCVCACVCALPLSHRGHSRAGSEPASNLEPVFPGPKNRLPTR